MTPRVLIVDDELHMRHMLCLYLDRNGCACITAADSYEAWALLNTVRFDLITQDLSRPDVDGVEFFSLARRDRRFADIPILIMSGVVALGTRKVPPEAEGVLEKPINLEELPATVEEVLARSGRPGLKPVERDALQLELDRTSPERIAAVLRQHPESGLGQAVLQAWKEDRGVRVMERLECAEAEEALIELLRCEAEPRTRFWAARALGRAGSRQAVDPLLGALAEGDEATRWAAAMALARLKVTDRVGPLLEALEDQSPLVRMMAVLALERIEDKTVLNAILGSLDDDDVWVRRAATQALWHLRDPRTAGPLIRTLSDPVPTLCDAAARALVQIGNPVVPALTGKLSDPTSRVRELTAWIFGQICSPLPVERLMATLNDDDADVAGEAAKALGRIGEARALAALERAAVGDTRGTGEGVTVGEEARKAIVLILKMMEQEDRTSLG